MSGDVPTDNTTLDQHDIMPIFQLRCVVCHGLRTRQAGLDLRTVASVLRGGKSGPAIVPGRAEDSLVLKRIHGGEMPPRRLLVEFAIKPMSAHEIEKLTMWIDAGAPEVEIEPDVATLRPDPLVSDKDRGFWSFQSPIAAPVPHVNQLTQVHTHVDAFVLRQLEQIGLTLSVEADRYTLIRRASFDLTGLPPTPEDVAFFVSDPDPQSYERLIDRLLNSPHYGERWGQYWLDLAGYSESEGVVNSDPQRAHAWRYRDYVIRSLNDDKPYDQFVMEQLAGDELADYQNGQEITAEIYDNLVATGFLRMAPDGTFESLTGYVPDRLELIDDEIEVFSSAMLGLTIRCARCHSHKFDPIPQRDYYRLAAVFKGALDENDWLRPNRQSKTAPGDRDRLLPHVTTKEFLDWQRAGAKPENQPLIRALWDRGDPSPTYILKRGNYFSPGRLVGPGVPSVLTNGQTPFATPAPWPGASKSGRRLALARWLVQADHPLTSRVMVNRIWRHHFERGIVETLDNFGKAGARPSHPQLLDWLAVRFVKSGWSIKSMHRLIMTSAVYRQSSNVTPRHELLDPDNIRLSRMPLRRMEGEVLRDTLFALAGRLDLAQYGPPEPVAVRDDGLVTSGGQTGRRCVYVLKRRTQPLTILQNFDNGQMDPNCVDRTESIVATQALHLNNNQLVRQLAQAFARRIWDAEPSDFSSQVERAYLIATGRTPDEDERRVSMDVLRRMRNEWAKTNVGTRHLLVATEKIWVREIEPERIFENDLISVWSSRSTDKGRRFGLVEFDLRPVAGLDLIRAELELGVLDTNPIRQSAAIIPPGIDRYSWSLFDENKAPHTRPLMGLGQYDSDGHSERIGSYATSEIATRQDLKLIEAHASKDGRLSLVLMADEDGKAYRRDWDDGIYRTTRHNAPRLVIHDSRPDVDAARRLAMENLCHALINSASFLYID